MLSITQEDEIDILKHQLLVVRNEFQDFTYCVSHDLGAPVRTLVNFSRLLGERSHEAFNEKDLSYLHFIIEGGEKLQAMLNGLVSYSRIITCAKPASTFALTALLDRCRNALKNKIAATNATISVRGTSLEITADFDQYVQLFLALIDNALTYHSKHATPHIEIAVRDIGPCWTFVVEDNGIGIPPDSTERVFEVFKRLHADDEFAGIGMGLTLAKKIVERHGGEIGIEPRSSGGTSCWFTLPKTLPDTIEERRHG